MQRRYDNDGILTIGDDHGPFQHPDTIPFLRAVKAKCEPDRIVHVGDSSDSYNFSSYPKHPEQISTNQEVKATRRYHAQLRRLFPELLMCGSNHADRLWNRAKVAGIPKGMLIPYLEMIGCNQGGWRLERSFTLTVNKTREQVLFAHHKMADVTQAAFMNNVNTVQGHQHTKAFINHIHLASGKRLFAVQNPCLLGFDEVAFAYNREHATRPVRGCTFIHEGVPYLIFMNLRKNGKWDGKLKHFNMKE